MRACACAGVDEEGCDEVEDDWGDEAGEEHGGPAPDNVDGARESEGDDVSRLEKVDVAGGALRVRARAGGGEVERGARME
eukprot:4218762-Pleurochrysis_carterae.AAC.1